MQRALLAFARSGDPNYAGMPRWEPYTPPRRTTMVFDVESRARGRSARRRAAAVRQGAVHPAGELARGYAPSARGKPAKRRCAVIRA